MDLDNLPLLFSGMLISGIGFVVFVYGKKTILPKALFIGFSLMALPLLVHSILWIWIAAVLGLAALKFISSG